MMKAYLRHGLRTGSIFGIILILLVLIGFQETGADILGNLLGIKKASSLTGLTPVMINILIFFGLIGSWAGAHATGKDKSTNKLYCILGSGVSGLTTGLFLGLFAIILGTLNNAGVRMNLYLAQLLPATVKTFTLDQATISAGLIYFVLLFLSALLGGGISLALYRAPLFITISSRVNAYRLEIQKKAWVRSKITQYVFYGLIILTIFLIPLRLNSNWVYTAGTIGIYVLLGLGLNIVVGLAGLLDLGYVAFFAIGAYTTALLTASAPQQIEWSFWAALPIGIVLAACAGILLGIPVLRMRGDYLAIVTLGFGEIIRILLSSDLLKNFSGGPPGVPGIGQPTLFGKPFSSNLDFLYLIMLAVLLVIFITNRLKDSRIGRAWESMREDETVAQAMGINTLQHKLLAFAIGAAFAGLGGALFASRNQFTGPEDHVLMVSINVLAVVIVGGMGSIPGVIAGAFVLKGLPEILRELENYRVLAFGGLLVVMMILRPEGLIPSSRRRMELHSIQVQPPIESPEIEEDTSQDLVVK